MATRPRILFAGTPAFAETILAALLGAPEYQIAAVLTQPDRPAGRGRRLRESAVKSTAKTNGLAVLQPATLREPKIAAELAALSPDLLVVAAYGLIIPANLLALPAIAPVNVHASLLPRWRGAAPVQHAILAGDAETGISIMRMAPELDAGPVYTIRRCEIHAGDNYGTLESRLAALGAQCLLATLPGIVSGALRPVPQDAAAACYAPKLDRESRDLDWRQSAEALVRRVRALAPSPGARAEIGGQTCKILEAETAEGRGPPGDLLAAADTGIDLAAADRVLRITRLQPPGKRAMTASEYLRGHRLEPA